MMRRSAFPPQPARSLFIAALRNHTRRTFASHPIKDPTPPDPIEPSKEQAHPLGAYYENILTDPQPIPEEKPEEAPTLPPTEPEEPPAKSQRGKKIKDDKVKASSLGSSPPIPTPTSTTASPSEQARVIFGSRLLGPAERAERLAAIKSQSRLIAGVLVPPRPDEPDNCCMSGCVNCVWDRYRDEVELWATANAQAEQRLRAQEAGVAATAESMTPRPAAARVGAPVSSTDDDGGGSAATWDLGNLAGQGAGIGLAKDFWDDALYQNVPVGIREFMKQEKRLKEKHMREGTFGG